MRISRTHGSLKQSNKIRTKHYLLTILTITCTLMIKRIFNDALRIFLTFFIIVRRELYRFRFKPGGRSLHYGLIDAIFYPLVDLWYRYASVIEELQEMDFGNTSILDVGGAGRGISNFINNERYKICVLDIDKNEIGRRAGVSAIVADGRKLPFRNSTFDVVVSVATIEHVPKISRRTFLQELKRVAKHEVIIYTPIVDDAGIYRAREYDISLVKNTKRFIKMTVEHIKCGHPSLEELKEVFPNATIKGVQNCDVWYNCLILESIPIPIFTGLFYMLFLKKRDNKPPFYACKLTYKL